MGFPKVVYTQQAPAVAGDFASTNTNKFSTIAGEGAFVAGPEGLTVGAFCWRDPNDDRVLHSFGRGPVAGFISREGLRADIITPGPGFPDASFTILGGSFVTAFNAGDFWMANNGASPSVIGQKAYANYANGLVTFGPTGTPPVSATATSATLQKIVSASTGGALPTTNTCTGLISGTTLTISAVGSGSVLAGGVGQTVTANGVDANTQIISQLTGAAGGIGTYQVSISQTVASTAMTLSGGGLTLTGANTSGVFAPGMTISGTNIPAGTTILAYGTGTAGGAGTYLVSNPATVAATASTITAANAMFFTADASSSGTWALNDLLEGSGVGSNQYIAATGVQNPNLTGLGGAGTYLSSAFQGSALTAQTISVYSGVETKWSAYYSGNPGELISSSSTPQG